jgi:hypothetical protein
MRRRPRPLFVLSARLALAAGTAALKADRYAMESSSDRVTPSKVPDRREPRMNVG